MGNTQNMSERINEKLNNIDSESKSQISSSSISTSHTNEKEEYLKYRLRQHEELIVTCMSYLKKSDMEKCYKDGIEIISVLDEIQHISKQDKMNIKENILLGLLYFFPEKIELYYYMACIFKETNQMKYIVWLNICLDKDPTFVETIMDTIKHYFDLGNIKKIDYLNEKYNKIIYENSNPRIQISVFAIMVKQNRLRTAKYIFDKLTDNFPPNTQLYLYNTIMTMFLKLSDTSKCIEYMNRGIEYAIQNMNNNESERKEINSDIMHAFYSNCMVQLDYLYYDIKDKVKIFNLFKSIHSSLPINDKFNPILDDKIYFSTSENNIIVKTPIKIGYVSSDLIGHAVSYFMESILENHSDIFEVYCFTNNEIIPYRNVKNYIPIGKLSAKEAASKIHEMKIDILIDLNGYTAGNRLDVFEYTPSPIQINYLGYPNSLYLDYIHYRITDSIADHPESKQLYSEKLVKLSCCFICFKYNYVFHPPIMTKSEESPILFGSFNKESKLNKHVLNLWKKILQENENSKILIKLDSVKNENIDRLKFYMDHLEVNESRIILIDYMDSETHYIDVLKQVDILLDTFPYSGTTTTCKSLFLSIPVLTLYNKDYHSHNVSSSILSHSGLNEFICENETEYMEKAKELYLNRDKLNHYKGGYIHDKFMECMDENKFIQNFENGILQIYMDALQNRKV